MDCNSLALCAIGKEENHYIREWVEHYKKIGFDVIFLYDNNDTEGEHFEDVIGDYIESGFVKIVNFRGFKQCQEAAYNDCYKTIRYNFDWIAFFDCDEFMQIEDFNTAKEYLSQDKFDRFNSIRLSWKTFNDSGLYKIKNDNYSITRFTEVESPSTFINSHIKAIYRGGIEDIEWRGSVHGVFHKGITACDAIGRPCKNTDKFSEYPYPIWEGAWLNHYRTKTLEEYIRLKMHKLYPDHTDEGAKAKLTMIRFFRYNDFTKEKWEFGLNLLKELGMEDRAGQDKLTFIQIPKRSIY